MKLRIFSFFTSLSMLVVASSAVAQEAPPPETVPDETATLEGDPMADPTLADAPPAEDPTLAAQSGPATEEPAEEEQDSGFRWGVGGMFGGMFVGSASGYAGGFQGRVGWQFNNMIGAYLQPLLLLGAAVPDVPGADAVGFAYGGVGALVDFSFARLIYMGLGPEFLSGGFSSAGGGGAVADAGGRFAIAARAGFRFGGFTVGLEFHTIFTPEDPSIMPMLGLGYDSF